MLAILVGLTAEAKLAKPLGCVIATGGGSAAGAAEAVARLIAAGATGLVSFGLAGGLAPALPAGTIIVPRAVVVPEAGDVMTDPALARILGGVTRETLFGGDAIAATFAEKRRLRQTTGAAAIDLESGAVARAATSHGLPFAVLRAICDPAERDLPPAALVALNERGVIGLMRVIASVIGQPRQLPSLLTLASDAAAARRALVARVAAIGQISTSS
jgi:adenosylhomocysteine nucleosidase